jgi:tetratricopeptide (TPR) repeat protein
MINYIVKPALKMNRIVKQIVLCFFVFTTLCGVSAKAQIEEDLREYFNDGEYFIAYGDYKEALYNFLNVLKKGINNANIQYRIGLCYINIEGEKIKGIPYLLEATKMVTLEYDEGNPKEVQAPIDAYFYLGVAYQINSEYDNAIENFRKYIQLLPKEDVLSLKFTKQQITACQYAKVAVNSPKNYEVTKLSNRINNNSPNIRSVVSGDGSTLVFMSKLKFYDAIFICKKDGDDWSFPKNINQEVRSDGNLYVSHISYDGTRLFFVMNDNFNSDIYYSDYNEEEKKWSVHEKLKIPVNSKYWESHASISKDGNTIYFASNRKGSMSGSMDIFYITKNEKGKWSTPENIGPKINTEFNEDSPYITPDGNKLFFCSQGHKDNLGGYDIFYCEKTGSTWSAPINIGYPINTSDDDLYFMPTDNGQAGYYSVINKEDPSEKEDIYKVKLQ